MTDNPILSLDEAAALLGISGQDLMLSRARGLTPGNLGYRQGGQLHWNRDDLAEFIPEKPKPKPKSTSKTKAK
jgi:hypothetical protein